MAPSVLGELEQLVLLAVLRQADAAYAVSVRDEIISRTAREISRGAVQVTLDRLERKGYLASRLGDPTAERGGKAKRLFVMTGAGVTALRTSLDGTRAMLEGLDVSLAKAPKHRCSV